MEETTTRSENNIPEFTSRDLIRPGVNIFIGIIFWQVYEHNLLAPDVFITCFSVYYVMVNFIVLVGLYRDLRNYRVYLLWLLPAIAQLIVYYLNNDNPFFIMGSMSLLNPLKGLLVMLVAYQVFRQIYSLLRGSDLIITWRRFTWFDFDDEREITWLDVTFSILIYGITILSLVL